MKDSYVPPAIRIQIHSAKCTPMWFKPIYLLPKSLSLCEHPVFPLYPPQYWMYVASPSIIQAPWPLKMQIINQGEEFKNKRVYPSIPCSSPVHRRYLSDASVWFGRFALALKLCTTVWFGPERVFNRSRETVPFPFIINYAIKYGNPSEV